MGGGRSIGRQSATARSSNQADAAFAIACSNGQAAQAQRAQPAPAPPRRRAA